MTTLDGGDGPVLARELPPQGATDRNSPAIAVVTFIPKDERTFPEYPVEPIRDSFARAFREK